MGAAFVVVTNIKIRSRKSGSMQCGCYAADDYTFNSILREQK